jgi:hypothetical protein
MRLCGKAPFKSVVYQGVPQMLMQKVTHSSVAKPTYFFGAEIGNFISLQMH